MNEPTQYIHKIGTVTLGIILIFFGVLFLARPFFPVLSFSFILKLWPVTFIFLGLEILCSRFRRDLSVCYDTAAVALLFFLLLFAVLMGVLEWFMETFPQQIYFNNTF